MSGASAAADRALLSVRGLSRSFGGVHALTDVSVEITAGESVGLIGPNGAGKTTLFNAVSGFDRRPGDDIIFGGRRIGRMQPHLRARCGLVRSFQGARTFTALTVEQHLHLAKVGMSRRSPGSESLDAAMELAAQGGLMEELHVRGADLPYGLMKLLGIVLSISTGARLIMLDEPSSGLGDGESETIANVLSTVVASGVAVWVVDHHLDFLSALADRLIVMDQGRILADGRFAEVVAEEQVQQIYTGEADLAREP